MQFRAVLALVALLILSIVSGVPPSVQAMENNHYEANITNQFESATSFDHTVGVVMEVVPAESAITEFDNYHVLIFDNAEVAQVVSRGRREPNLVLAVMFTGPECPSFHICQTDQIALSARLEKPGWRLS